MKLHSTLLVLIIVAIAITQGGFYRPRGRRYAARGVNKPTPAGLMYPGVCDQGCTKNNEGVTCAGCCVKKGYANYGSQCNAPPRDNEYYGGLSSKRVCWCVNQNLARYEIELANQAPKTTNVNSKPKARRRFFFFKPRQ